MHRILKLYYFCISIHSLYAYRILKCTREQQNIDECKCVKINYSLSTLLKKEVVLLCR